MNPEQAEDRVTAIMRKVGADCTAQATGPNPDIWLQWWQVGQHCVIVQYTTHQGTCGVTHYTQSLGKTWASMEQQLQALPDSLLPPPTPAWREGMAAEGRARQQLEAEEKLDQLLGGR